MKVFMIIIFSLMYINTKAQAILIGIDLVPRPIIEENTGLVSSMNVTDLRSSMSTSSIEYYIGYRFNDDDNTLLSLKYSRGGYGKPSPTTYYIYTTPTKWDLLMEYHLFRINYGTWNPTRNGRNAFMPLVGILLAPTQYTLNKTLVDYFGNNFTETYKKNRINFGFEFGGNYLLKVLGPVYIKTGGLIVITPQVTSPLSNDPYPGYYPELYIVPGGGWLPIVNILFNFGVTIEIE